MSIRNFAILAWLLFAATATSPALALPPCPFVLPAFFASGPLILDDKPEPLSPKNPKTEADRDKVEAMALFSSGRMHEQREELADALRCYQKAFRMDPKSSTTAQAVVRTAVKLQRPAEAARYALKAAEFEDADPVFLRDMGNHLTDSGDREGAMRLYEKALASKKNAKDSVSDILLRMEMGRNYHFSEKYGKAAESFARVLHALAHPAEFPLDDGLKKVLLGDPGETYEMMGDCFLAADRPEEAKAAFLKADEIAPNKALRQLNLARVYVKSGKPTEALAALEASFAEPVDVGGSLPFHTLADILVALGKKDELPRRLEKLRLAMPNNEFLGDFLARHYCETKQFDKAESLYHEQIKTPHATLAYRDLSNLYRENKRYDDLLAILGEAIEKDGLMETIEAESLKASESAELTRGIVEAARSKLKTEPEKCTRGMRLAAAISAMNAKQYETAGEFFNLALTAKGDSPDEVFLWWGVSLLTDNRPSEAAKVFQRALDQQASLLAGPQSLYQFYLAGALVLIGRTDEALVAAEAAARTATDTSHHSAQFRARPAWVLYYAKRHDEAMKAYRELIDRFDAERDEETRLVLLEARRALSNLCAIQGDIAQAEEWLEQVLDEFPDDPGAMNDLGYLWVDQGKRLDRAHRMIERAVAADPNNMAFRDSLGWAKFRLGKYSEAVAELEKAAADKKSDGVVFDHLGDAYHKTNQLDKAVETWRKAVKAFQKEKEEKKATAVENKIRAN